MQSTAVRTAVKNQTFILLLNSKHYQLKKFQSESLNQALIKIIWRLKK